MLHYKLFGADHVPDIVGTSGSALVAGLISSGSRLLERMLKHLLCLILFPLLKFSCSMSCIVVVYTPEVFMLAYFVAKRGRKRYIYMPAYYVYACVFCIYFADLPIFLYFCCCIYFATISGLCRCCH